MIKTTFVETTDRCEYSLGLFVHNPSLGQPVLPRVSDCDPFACLAHLDRIPDGPIIGGALSRPAERLPTGLFGNKSLKPAAGNFETTPISKLQDPGRANKITKCCTVLFSRLSSSTNECKVYKLYRVVAAKPEHLRQTYSCFGAGEMRGCNRNL